LLIENEDELEPCIEFFTINMVAPDDEKALSRII